MPNKKNFIWLGYLLILPVLLFFHYPLILKDPLLMRDDVLLISSLDLVGSFSEYWVQLINGDLWDIQPVRDLTFYFNIKAYHLWGFGGFHLVNFLLFFIILYLLRTVLKIFKFNEEAIFFSLALLALHPVMNSSVAWVSNRKHLLAGIFILLFFLDFLKHNKGTWKGTLYCLLSFYSQPVAIFIPVLLIGYERVYKLKKINLWEIAIGLISIATLAVNYWYYSTNVRFLARNIADALNNTPGHYILMLGRVPFQILFPISLGVEYDPANYFNFVGVALWVVLIYIYIKKYFQEKPAVWGCIILTSLFPVLKWGVRDPYLIITLLLTSFIAAFWLNLKNYKKHHLLGFIPVLIFFSFYSFKFTRMWTDDLTLHKTSYEVEGGLNNMFRYAIVQSREYPHMAYDILNSVVEEYPNKVNNSFLALRSQAIFLDPSLSDEKKLEKYRSKKDFDLFDAFFMSKIHLRNQNMEQYEKARETILTALKDPEYRLLFIASICSQYEDECKELDLL